MEEVLVRGMDYGLWMQLVIQSKCETKFRTKRMKNIDLETNLYCWAVWLDFRWSAEAAQSG